MGQDDTAQLIAAIAIATQRVLSDTFGQTIRLGTVERIDQPPRSTPTLRFPLLNQPGDAPPAIIVKCVHSPGRPYNPAAMESGSAARQLADEWSGLQFLSSLPGGTGDPPVGPRCYGGDRAAGIVVMEDLGAGACLADFLQGADPALAEAGLLAYAATLGRLHAATVGREREYEQVRQSFGLPPAEPGTGRDAWFPQSVAALLEGCRAIDLTPPSAVESDAAAVDTLLRNPGPFLAFTPADTCPDNHRYLPATDGGPGHVRLFDFARSQYQHAFLDSAYGRVPFPTCWCVNRLPDDIPPRMEAAYRAELITGCPAAGDDARFGEALVAACAFWTVCTIGPDLIGLLEADRQWGISTRRQRVLLRLDTLATATEQFGRFALLGALARQMSARLRERWPDAEMPLYPAFHDRT